MTTKPLFASLTRIADLETRKFDTLELPREQWDTGDYVVGQVDPSSPRSLIELTSGRMVEAGVGDLVVGALGIRAATLEAVGAWQDIGSDRRMHALTSAGLFGQATSVSTFIPPLVKLNYRGHVCRDDQKVCMRDYVLPAPPLHFDRPTVLLIGTSMSSGKTTSAKVIIRQLKKAGVSVAGAKLTGAGRYRDILGMRDAGADAIFDFVDVGLPSTICPGAEYQRALTTLLQLIAAEKTDVVVAEAGASPLEPYNGDIVVQQLHDQIECTVLCASDPYAVVGVTKGFGFQPDFVAGLATSTSAGVEVIEKLTGTRALNLIDPESEEELAMILTKKLSCLETVCNR